MALCFSENSTIICYIHLLGLLTESGCDKSVNYLSVFVRVCDVTGWAPLKFCSLIGFILWRAAQLKSKQRQKYEFTFTVSE